MYLHRTPEVEFTEIILTKVQDFGQLASHKRGFFQIFPNSLVP